MWDRDLPSGSAEQWETLASRRRQRLKICLLTDSGWVQLIFLVFYVLNELGTDWGPTDRIQFMWCITPSTWWHGIQLPCNMSRSHTSAFCYSGGSDIVCTKGHCCTVNSFEKMASLCGIVHCTANVYQKQCPYCLQAKYSAHRSGLKTSIGQIDRATEQNQHLPVFEARAAEFSL